jgi:SAM-dependent methyltransferase
MIAKLAAGDSLALPTRRRPTPAAPIGRTPRCRHPDPRSPSGPSRVSTVTETEAWLATNWSFVRRRLPEAPARVLEIGCGPQGGFVPLMLRDGYDAVGVDPEAPGGSEYLRIEFEQLHVAQQYDAVVACTSLHHVADLGQVLEKVSNCLTSPGALVVVEWAWERFDEETARWCFARLADVGAESSEHGWLRKIQDEWAASGQPWRQYLRGWASREGLHTGQQILEELDERFECRSVTRSPAFFTDLDRTTEADEQAAIDAGRIQAGGIRYVGQVQHARPGAR